MECDANYYATANRCEKCRDVSGAASTWQILSVVTAVTLIALGLGFWRYRTADIGDIPQKKRSAFQVLTEQVKAQAPILLQTCPLASQSDSNSTDVSSSLFCKLATFFLTFIFLQFDSGAKITPFGLHLHWFQYYYCGWLPL